MMLRVSLSLCVLSLVACDVSHVLKTTTEPPPPRPYVFSYSAGRFPGHSDRQHTEVSDGSGVVRGSYSYVDPRNEVRTVDYVADKEGFHPVLSNQPEPLPRDSASVARAKDRHYQLYNKIAHDHAENVHPEAAAPRQSAAVLAETLKHSELFRVIAEQHARIAAERETLQQEDEEKQLLQDIEH